MLTNIYLDPSIASQALGSDVGRCIEGIICLKFTFCHFCGWQSSKSAEQRQ